MSKGEIVNNLVASASSSSSSESSDKIKKNEATAKNNDAEYTNEEDEDEETTMTVKANALNAKELCFSNCSSSTASGANQNEDDDDDEDEEDDNDNDNENQSMNSSNNNKQLVRINSKENEAAAVANGSKKRLKLFENLKLKQILSANKKFQRLFANRINAGSENSLTKTIEPLINMFNCALLRNNSHLLLQGTLYVTKTHFAFHSNIFGYQTFVHELWSNVNEINKESVLLFPTAISIKTIQKKKYFFASFLSRNQAFKIFVTLKNQNQYNQNTTTTIIQPSVDLNNNNINKINSQNKSSAATAAVDQKKEEKEITALNTSAGDDYDYKNAPLVISHQQQQQVNNDNQEEQEFYYDEAEENISSNSSGDDDDNDDGETTSTTTSIHPHQHPQSPPIVILTELTQPESQLESKSKSSFINLAQSLFYFLVLNRLNLFFIDKIQLFVQYFIISSSYNHQTITQQQDQHQQQKQSSNQSSQQQQQQQENRSVFCRLRYTDVIILISFLIVSFLLYLYVFVIFTKVNRIETKLAELFDSLDDTTTTLVEKSIHFK